MTLHQILSENNRAMLLAAVKAHTNLPEAHHSLVVMLCKQLHRRWLKFCSSSDNNSPTPSQDAVQRFIADNIEWAKIKVTARIDRVFWGLPPDEEYDPDAEF